MVACRSIWAAASWLLALTSTSSSAPLLRRVTPSYPSPPAQDKSHQRTSLRCLALGQWRNPLMGRSSHCQVVNDWTVQLAQILPLDIGSSSSQTCWELLAILIV
eukprot:3140155-Amphidinium_carterae.1